MVETINEEKPRRALVVLGMHRGGTSALARLLILLGADGPDEPWPADVHNETGYWEPAPVVDLHNEIFAATSSSWDDLRHLPPSWPQSESAQVFQERAAELLRTGFGSSRLFVLKDPRMCRMIPFWRRVFDQADVEPSYVLVNRNPIEVAYSLRKRDGMALGRGLLFWLREMLTAELETRGQRRVFVSYEQVLDDWRSVATRISDGLDVPLSEPGEEAVGRIEGFLSPGRRHAVADRAALEGRDEVVHWVQTAYVALDDAIAAGTEPDRDALDLARGRFEQAERAFAPVLATEFKQLAEGIVKREAAIVAGELEAELLAAKLAERTEQLEAERESAQARGEWIRHLESSRSWRLTRPVRAFGRLSRRLRGRKTADQPDPPEISEALADRPPSGSVEQQRQLEAGEETGELDPRQQELAAWIRHLERSWSWRLTRPVRALARAVRRIRGKPSGEPEAPAVSEAAEAAADANGHPGELEAGEPFGESESHPELAASTSNGEVAPMSEEQLVEWIRHIEHSRSWRMTRPVRAVGTAARRLRGRPADQPPPPGASDAAQLSALKASRNRWRFRGGENGATPGDGGPSALSAEEVVAQIRASTNPGEYFEELDPEIGAGREPRAKLMAFYLPQFHAIPENDEWWGKGFTEWRNVMRGTPRFRGHYQPRVPRDLGHYDLGDVGVMRRQAELARRAGIHGFSFHYYWFDRKRLLEAPLERFLADRSIEIPFCLTWANESWTRRWDGGEDQVLLRQDYDPADDAHLIDDLQRHFDDPRYLRLDGRPLLLIYRMDVIPNARQTVERWRRAWEERHGEQPLIFGAQTFSFEDPRPYELDGAVEFPPHKHAATADTQTSLSDGADLFDSEFEAGVHDYDAIARRALAYPDPDYPLVRSVVPSWDNDARRQGSGLVLHGSTPERYADWLRGAIELSRRKPVYGESLVFVNAWNEWAEAAYLEPDVHFGSAYLNATARAVFGSHAAAPEKHAAVVGRASPDSPPPPGPTPTRTTTLAAAPADAAEEAPPPVQQVEENGREDVPTIDQTSSPATEPRATSVLVPQHSYNMELESGENPFATHFGALSDADWLAVLKRSLTEPEIEGIEFPGFPEEELQSRIHGNAGGSAIEEAFNFYRFCRDNTYGTSAGGEQRRLLDFGAGWGRMTRAFMRDFSASGLYGYEPNLLFSTLARSLNPYVCYMTGPQLPDRSLPSGWFDLVVGYSVFSHLPERSAGAWLAEINRSLRPGGWCVLTTWGRRLLDLLTEQKERLERGEEIHWYHETLLSRIGDIPARAREFDAGEFIFLGEDDALYGDTVLSEAALRRVLQAEGLDFELLRFDVTTLPQDAFVLQRPS